MLHNATKGILGEEHSFFFKVVGAVLCALALVTPLSVTIYHCDIFSSVNKGCIPYLMCRASAAQPS